MLMYFIREIPRLPSYGDACFSPLHSSLVPFGMTFNTDVKVEKWMKYNGQNKQRVTAQHVYVNLLVPVEVPGVSGRGWRVAGRAPRRLGSLKDGESRPPTDPLSAPVSKKPAGVGGCGSENQDCWASSEAANKFQSFPVWHPASRRTRKVMLAN